MQLNLSGNDLDAVFHDDEQPKPTVSAATPKIISEHQQVRNPSIVIPSGCLPSYLVMEYRLTVDSATRLRVIQRVDAYYMTTHRCFYLIASILQGGRWYAISALKSIRLELYS